MFQELIVLTDVYRQVPYVATSPNLLAAFIRVLTGESITSKALATSQAFYVIRGTGSSESEFGVTNWSEGDLFVLPTTQLPVRGHCLYLDMDLLLCLETSMLDCCLFCGRTCLH